MTHAKRRDETSTDDRDDGHQSVARGVGTRRQELSLSSHHVALPLVLLALAVFFTLQSDAFLTSRNLLSILKQATPIAIAGIGTAIVLISGGIDISAGPVAAGAAVISVALLERGGVGEVVAIGTALGFGLAIGLLNGSLSEYAKVPAFIATLATGLVVRGALFVYTESRSIGLSSGEGSFLRWVGNGDFGPIPASVLLAVVVIALAAFALRRTVWGLHCFGVGSSAEASRIAGVRVAAQRTSVYAVAGLLSATAGLVIGGRLAAANAGFVTGFEFVIITAAVLGGTSIYGGRGSVGGVVLGAIVLAILSNGLVLMNVPSFYQDITVGIVLLLALSLDSWNSSETKGRRRGRSPKKRQAIDADRNPPDAATGEKPNVGSSKGDSREGDSYV